MVIQPTHEAASLRPWPEQIIIVGCGGVGSYLIPPLLRTVRNHAEPKASPEIRLFDGDTLELKNMDRQLFRSSDIGRNKAIAMAEQCGDYYPNLIAHPLFFTGGERSIGLGALIVACVDNHPGRVRILDAADRVGGDAIICGNGYTDSEAMFYASGSRGSKADPRIVFPEITTDHTDDPLLPADSCTGQAQEKTPQLAIANFLAAAYALHLMWFHYQEAHKLDEEARGHSPIRHASNFTKLATTKLLEINA